MKIYQVLPVFAYGDAIGNDTMALHSTIQGAGYETHIFAERISDNRIPKDICSPISELRVETDDIIIYHLSTGSELNYKIVTYNCRVILKYHNITPAVFFDGYNRKLFRNCKQGLEAVRFLKDKVEYVLADSGYNRNDLQNMGYMCKIDVLPILIPLDDYKQQPNQKVIEQYQDGKTNIVFMGRVAPNKKQEDIIAAFAMYKKYYNSASRLILVGTYSGMEQYYGQLNQYVQEMRIDDVIFTGHIPFDEVLAYYHVADCFLCMSEHEGFCVPLVEAMFFNIPIIAYNSTAIGETLGDAGWLLEEKKPILTASVMNRILTDHTVRENMLWNQQNRLKDFAYEKVSKQFIRYLQEFIKQ